MPVPASISDLSTTPALNSPAGSESPALVDDYLRTHAAFIKQVSDSNDNSNVKLTGDQTVAGIKTFSSPIAGSTTTQVSLTGNETIAGIKTFSSAPVVPGLNAGQLAGMRNKIINGDMNISQRGTSFPAITSGAYSLDRWAFVNNSSAVITASQQSDVPSSNEFQNSLRAAITTADASIAAGDVSAIYQVVEGFNARDLIGRTFTLSFWVRSSKTGIHCLSLRNAGQDRTYVAEYTVNAANTWEYKTVTVSGGLLTAGTWNWTNGAGVYLQFTLAAGSTYQTTAGAWNTGSFFATANQVNCLDTIGNIFAITGVQLEVGSVATPFEHRPYGAELALCQRYYEIGNYSLGAYNTTGNGISAWIAFKSTKRAAPSFIANGTSGSNVGAVAVDSISVDGARVVYAVSATGSATGAGNWAAAIEL